MKTKLLVLFFGLFAMSLYAQKNLSKNVDLPKNQNQTKDITDFWEVQNSSFSETSRGIRDISIVDENIVWAIAYDGSGAAANVQEFTKTTDGGATWTPGTIDIGSTGSGIAMISAISDTTAWIVAFPNASGDKQGIFKTTDGGATWVEQTTALYDDPSSFSNVVYFWDENNGFCEGDPIDGYFELYTTTDGGDNWTRVPSANIPAFESGEYGYTSQIFVTGDALWYTTNHGRIYRSYDHGYNFEVFQSPLSDFGSAAESGEISFADDNNGYLINQDGTFWKSSDGGATWALTFPDTGLIFGGNIFAVPGTDWVYSTGAGDLTGSSYSRDAGANWEVMSDVQHLDIRMTTDGATGWSGGFNGGADGTDPTVGGMFKYIGPGAGVSDLTSKGFMAYPNPVVDNFNMSALEEISNVNVYDILGKLILSEQPNTLRHQINMSGLAKGTYIVQVTIGDTTGAIKLVK